MAWPTKTDFADGDVLTAAQVNNIGTNLNLANPTGITDGYVLTADGANSMGWEALPASGGLTLLASGTFTTTTTLSSIPGTYKQLQLDLWGFPSTIPTIQIRPNGVTTDTTSTNVLIESGTPASSGTNNTSWQLNNAGVGYHYYSAQIFNYANTSGNQTIFAQGVGFVVSTSRNNYLLFGRRTTTNAITSLQIFASSTLSAAANYRLYGVN